MNLYLFTNFFPYEKAEPFLSNEFQYTGKYFKNINILSLYGSVPSKQIDGLVNANLYKPVLSSSDKFNLFLKGVFNLAPYLIHVKEIFKKGLWYKPKKLYWQIVSLLICRAAMSSSDFKRLIQNINSSENSVLYFYWGDNLCWLIPYLNKKIKSKTKIIVRLHGSDIYEELKGDHAPLRDAIFNIADTLYTVSAYGKAYLDKRYPKISSKIKVSRLGVNDHGLNPEGGDVIRVVSVSNVIPLKRVGLIVDVLDSLNISLEWHHFGDGIDMPQLELKCAQLNNKGLKVHLHGFVANSEIHQFYKNKHVHLFINLSTTEGVPVSIMEALSYGVPVVATDVGGSSELVSSEVGELVNPNDSIKNMSEIISRLINLDAGELKKLRRNARTKFELLANSEKNYKEFYETIVNKN